MAAEKTTDNTAPVPSHSGNLSRILQEIRENRGLNVNQVAEALCLSPRIITSLEEERLDDLPEPPYVRGYLRSYAKFAEVDDAPLVDAYEKLRGADPQEMDYRANIPSSGAAYKSSSRSGMSSGILRFGLLILLLGLLAMLAMIPGVRGWFTDTWNSFSEQTSGEFPAGAAEENPLLTGNIPAPLPIDETVNTNTDSSSDTGSANTAGGTAPVEGETATGDSTTAGNQTNAGFPSVSDNTDENSSGDANATEGSTENGTEGGDDADDKTETAQVPEGSSQIKLTFNDEVWMRIRDPDKKSLFETLAKKGETRELVLEKPMTFRVGNAQKLEVMIDGKPFDMTPHIRGSVANFTIE